MPQKKESWEINNDKTNATYETSDAQRKKNCNRGTALEQLVGKLLGSLNHFFTRANLSLNSDVASNYKYMFGPHGDFLPSVKYHSETHIVKITVMKRSEELNGDLKLQYKKTTTSRKHTYIILTPLDPTFI